MAQGFINNGLRYEKVEIGRGKIVGWRGLTDQELS